MKTAGPHIGFVVIEWNQASGRPAVMDNSFTDYFEDADTLKDHYEAILPLARRETYTIAVVSQLEDA